MRILLLAHSFNSLTQRLYVELRTRGHELSVEFDIHERVTEEAVALWQPDLVIAPFLKRAIPETVWRTHRCLIVHPGPEGDRGPSSLDWALMDGAAEWGVTVLQAEAEMDAGPVWASEPFPLRKGTKSSVYRREVTEAAVRAVLRALERIGAGDEPTRPAGRSRPLVRQSERAIDWTRDRTATVLSKIAAADGWPGVRDASPGGAVSLFDAQADETGQRGEPGAWLGCHGDAACRATVDGAVWIGHLLDRRGNDGGHPFKLPARVVLAAQGVTLPELDAGPEPIVYEERGAVGYLHFSFYNGAMSTEQCARLQAAFEAAQQRPTKVICLMGGEDFWSNGIHLNAIEAADSPADASWRNINAMNDLVRCVLTAERHVTVAVLRGNCAAGGCFLAMAADRVVARDGVVLNPHYKNMGNLYGSEYWSYVLPRRAGADGRESVMEHRLPMGVDEARELGVVDDVLATDGHDAALASYAEGLVADAESLLATKRERRARDEAEKPLEAYRSEELERMRLNFYGFDPSYHVARYYFVHKTCASRTPLHLAVHR